MKAIFRLFFTVNFEGKKISFFIFKVLRSSTAGVTLPELINSFARFKFCSHYLGIKPFRISEPKI